VRKRESIVLAVVAIALVVGLPALNTLPPS